MQRDVHRHRGVFTGVGVYSSVYTKVCTHGCVQAQKGCSGTGRCEHLHGHRGVSTSTQFSALLCTHTERWTQL